MAGGTRDLQKPAEPFPRRDFSTAISGAKRRRPRDGCGKVPAKATLVKSTYGSTEKQEGGQWWFLCVDRGCRFAGDSFPVIIIGALYSLIKIDPHHMKPIDPKGYTIREAEFIHGRRPLYEADSHVIYPIYRKATAYGDDDILQIIDCRYAELRAEHERVTKENYKRNQCKLKEKNMLYGYGNYTERQLQIINGYIPYDDITGYDCKSIRSIAKKKQDTEVLEIVGCLSDRIRSDYKKRHKAIRSEILRNNSKFLPDDQRVHDFFTTWERQILSRYSDTSKINSKTLSKLLYRAHEFGDPAIIERAEFICSLYQDENGEFVEPKKNSLTDECADVLFPDLSGFF